MSVLFNGHHPSFVQFENVPNIFGNLSDLLVNTNRVANLIMSSILKMCNHVVIVVLPVTYLIEKLFMSNICN